MVSNTSLGQLLLKSNLITEQQLREALHIKNKEGKRLGEVLLNKGAITEKDLSAALSSQYKIPLIDLSAAPINKSLHKILPTEKALKYQVAVFSRQDGTLNIAVADPLDLSVIDEIKFHTGLKTNIFLAEPSAIKTFLERQHTHNPQETKSTRPSKPAKPDISDADINLDKIMSEAVQETTVVEEKEEDIIREVEAPIVKLVNGILINAINSSASDIHIEPSEKVILVRYRIDGVLQEMHKLPIKIKGAVTSRIKILSHLDISERRLPQDGRIKMKFGDNKEIDFRVSTLPTLFGEKVVMRILDKANLQVDLTKLGFDEKPLQDFMNAIEKPYGMILVTGPTGSGKTTTLYSALSQLNKPGVNIMTAEDPVEYNFFGINQVQIKEEIGLTFASALRSFLRQDPDIIMVGEIRDFETAEIAVKAALTGHLVLSTLHTNDAPSTITRLINMGIEPFLVSSSVILILAQRLARKICQNCKEEQKVSEPALLKIGVPAGLIKDAVCYTGKGCPACSNTGYKGRIALYEVMPVKEELKDLVLTGAPATEIKKEAVRLGMLTLRQSAVVKMLAGVIPIEEVGRVTFED